MPPDIIKSEGRFTECAFSYRIWQPTPVGEKDAAVCDSPSVKGGATWIDASADVVSVWVLLSSSKSLVTVCDPTDAHGGTAWTEASAFLDTVCVPTSPSRGLRVFSFSRYGATAAPWDPSRERAWASNVPVSRSSQLGRRQDIAISYSTWECFGRLLVV